MCLLQHITLKGRRVASRKGDMMGDWKDVSEYTAEYTIRNDDMEAGGSVSPAVIAGLCLGTMGRHSKELGISVFDLIPDNRTWVLSRLSITLEQHPEMWDEIKIKTWPSGAKRLFAYRNFLIYDSIGIIIGAASSVLLAIDTVTRRPLKIRPLLESLGYELPEFAPDDASEKLLAPENPTLSNKFKVRLSDIDINDHVTSKSYIEWALDCVPAEVRHDYVFNEFTVNYLAETFLDEEVIARAEMSRSGDTYTFNHIIERGGDKRILALARSIWRRVHKY